MKRRIIALIAVATLILTAVSLVSCNKVPEVPYTTVTRITYDAIANVEIIVNFQNDVVAVTPFNDAAEIILAGEDYRKQAPDKVVAEITALAAKAGYLTAAETIKISVSGEGEYVDVISKMIKKETEKAADGYGVKVEFTESATNEELRQLNREVGYYSEEVLKSIPDSDLIFALAQCRVGVLSLPDMDFGYAFFTGVDRMSLVHQKNGIADIVKNMGDAHTGTYVEYRTALDKYEAAAAALDKLVYDSYLDPTAEYRALKNDVREALANIGSGREAYDTAVAALESKKAEIKERYNALVDAFAVEADNLTALERAFNQEIMTEYRAKAMDIINAALEEEKTFLDKFTSDYKDAITAANTANESFKSKIG